jgi:predicted glycogen debranching enzyme
LDAKAPAAPQDVKYPSLSNRLEAAAEQYRLTTKSGFHSLIAGYPWFGHWGRDTFVSLPGFYLNTGNARDSRTAVEILRSYGELILGGLQRAEVNMTGADTPLLYIRAVQELKNFAPRASYLEFMPTVCKILNALKGGVDRRVHVSPDCGLWVDQGRWAMTWMDVMLDGQAVTPRSGFAVDLNALFLNAVQFALDWAETNDDKFTQEWKPLRDKGDDAFLKRFWSDKFGYLADTHNGETADFSLRPNQLWALALPHSPISRERGAKILEIIQKELLTPVGLRTLSPKDPKYRGRYHGSARERDLAYHQGSVWPWLLGIYSDALIHIFGVKKVKEQLTPIIKRLTHHIEHEACLGQISEIFDGDAPHQPGGAPAQAWSVAELLRVLRGMES